MEGDQQLTPDADMGMSASDQSSSPSDEPHGAASLTGSTPEHNSQVSQMFAHRPVNVIMSTFFLH